MTVSPTTDAPVDLEVDLLLLPFTAAPSEPFIRAQSGQFGAAGTRAKEFEEETGDGRALYPEPVLGPRAVFLGLGVACVRDAEALRTAGAVGGDVVLDPEAQSVACLLPAEDQPRDARTVQGLVEGFVLGTYRDRRGKTADGFEGPSAFLVRAGADRNLASGDEGGARVQHLARGACTASGSALGF